jgi:hypothetical protein
MFVISDEDFDGAGLRLVLFFGPHSEYRGYFGRIAAIFLDDFADFHQFRIFGLIVSVLLLYIQRRLALRPVNQDQVVLF